MEQQSANPVVRFVGAVLLVSGWFKVAVFCGIVIALLVLGDTLGRVVGAVLGVALAFFVWRSLKSSSHQTSTTS